MTEVVHSSIFIYFDIRNLCSCSYRMYKEPNWEYILTLFSSDFIFAKPLTFLQQAPNSVPAFDILLWFRTTEGVSSIGKRYNYSGPTTEIIWKFAKKYKYGYDIEKCDKPQAIFGLLNPLPI